MENQPEPSDVTCPYCGAEPEPNPKHNLQAIGYLHDDILMECSECGEDWVHGVPIGEQEDSHLAEKLFCGACEERYGLVHRVSADLDKDEVEVDVLRLHLKCPECKYFWTWERDDVRDNIHNTILVGYPSITGDMRSAENNPAIDKEEHIE